MDKIDINIIKQKLADNFDIKYREINYAEGKIHIVFCKTLCDQKFTSMHVITPLINNKEKTLSNEYIKDNIITTSNVEDLISNQDAIDQILTGSAVIILEYSGTGLFVESKAFSSRNIEIPPTEAVIKGPREGFNENLDDNIAHIRRRIRNSDLKIEFIRLGDKSKTTATMIYIKGLAPEPLVNHIRKKILGVQKDYVVYENLLEETLKNKGTPFDTIGYTEKADVATVKIEEGRIIVIINGSPFVLIAPYFFMENFHTADDYTLNKFVAVGGRCLRWLSFFSAILLPGLYVALFTYHFKLIPYIFAFGMARSRVAVPFPLAVEVIIMTMFFQLLRETGVRLLQPIGPSLSIVGALILGDAAVRAGMASNVTVLIVALTSIGTFLIPGLFIAVAVWDIITITFSAFLGLPGFFTAFILFCAHLSGLTSCGYPYLYPLGTLKKFKYRDIVLRGDLVTLNQKIFQKDEDE